MHPCACVLCAHGERASLRLRTLKSVQSWSLSLGMMEAPMVTSGEPLAPWWRPDPLLPRDRNTRGELFPDVRGLVEVVESATLELRGSVSLPEGGSGLVLSDSAGVVAYM